MKPNKAQAQHADFCNALSHKRRQMLCAILIEHGGKGLPFHVLKRKVGLKVSTLTHHLAHMTKGGLITRHQVGRETYISVDYAYFKSAMSEINHTMAQLAARPRVAA